MFISILSFLPAIIGLLLVGSLVYLNNPKNYKNIVFLAFNLTGSLWLGLDYFAGQMDSSNAALWLFRFVLFFGQLAPLLFYVFVHYFPSGSSFNLKKQLLPVVGYLFFVLATLTPLNVVSVEIRDYGIAPKEIGPLYNFSDLLSVAAVVAGIFMLIRKYFRSKSIFDRKQIRLVAIGVSMVLLGAVFANIFLLRVLENDSWTVLIGNYTVLLFSITVGYAIIRHRLFDVRLVVVRSLGYIISIGLIFAVTAFVIFGLSNILIGQGISQSIRLWLYVLVTIILSVVYQPTKKYFDRVTNRLFYQDAYEAQGLLDELNQVLVSTVELELMLKKSADVIARNIKPEYCVFGLEETDYEEQRIIGEADRKFHKDDIDFARTMTPQMGHKVIVADYLEEGNKDLRRRMRKNDVAVLVRITSDVEQQGVGYIVLGAKKSGNPYNSQDIRVLETIANAMVIAIDNALRFEEIQKFNITLEKKVEDATRRLQRANDKLVALDQTKDDFISMASHQLRTPLTSVKGYLSMVLEGDAGKVNPKQAKLLDQAFISSQRMVYLIADLLNVSRLRTGKFVIEATEVNLADVVEGEVTQLIPTAAARGLKLTYHKPKSSPALMLDETKIRQVIMNFIDNAIYYTPAGGNIDVYLRDNGRFIEYMVKDSGIGVPKSEQHNLFTKFFRAGNARKARPDGTGLGLFMAKKVIVAQGGAVLFTSAEGKGSTFGFTFEKSKLAPSEKAKSPEAKS